MLVVFIGGPKHGQQQQLHHPSRRIWVEDKNGAQFLDELRNEFACGVGNRPMKPYEAWYAPVGMSDEEMYRLEEALEIEREDE
jgi:hypothetical protein